VYSSARQAQLFFDEQTRGVRERLVAVRLTLNQTVGREWGLKRLLDEWDEKLGGRRMRQDRKVRRAKT